MNAAMSFFLIFFLFFYLIWGLILLLPYIFRAVGLNEMMKGRGLPSGWRAWVPVVQMWSLGKLADDVGREKGARIWCAKTLLWLSIAKAILYVVSIAGLSIYAILQAQYYYFYSSETLFAVVYSIVFLLLVVVHFGHVVICFMAYYRIVVEYAPNAAIGVLVGGVVAGAFGFSATIPYDICLFVIRKRQPLSRTLVHWPWNGGYEAVWAGGGYPPQGPLPAPWSYGIPQAVAYPQPYAAYGAASYYSAPSFSYTNAGYPYTAAPPPSMGMVQPGVPTQPWNPAQPYSAQPMEQGPVQAWSAQQGYAQPWYAQPSTAPNANSWNAPAYSGVPRPQTPPWHSPMEGIAGQPPLEMSQQPPDFAVPPLNYTGSSEPPVRG